MLTNTIITLSILITRSNVLLLKISNAISQNDYQLKAEKKINLPKNIFTKHKHNLRDKKMHKLNDYISMDTIYLNNIPHVIVNENNFEWKKIQKIENQFKELIAMKDSKYIYKRDMYWRTWRKITHPNGTSGIVFYKYNNIVNLTGDCKSCSKRGFWVIEQEPPPCPYEFFSLLNDKQLCGVLNTKLEVSTACPSIINFNDITMACDNPIKTKWRIKPSYNKQSNCNIICGGAKYCGISTFYLILHDAVIFRIANKTNYIIYSKVMKNNRKNYACTQACGQMDSDTLTVSKIQKPPVHDLLNSSSHKNKIFPTMDKHQVLVQTKSVNMIDKSNIWKLDVQSDSISISNLKNKRITSITLVLPATKTGNEEKNYLAKYLIEQPLTIRLTTISNCKKLAENKEDGSKGSSEEQ